MLYLMVKKTPSQVGYSRLGTYYSRKDATTNRDSWAALHPEWVLDIREPTTYSNHDKIWEDTFP